MKPEIVGGSLVIFKNPEDLEFGKHIADKTWQVRTIDAHGIGPFGVYSRPDSEHVVLVDQNGKVINFGSTGDPRLHIGHVKLW